MNLSRVGAFFSLQVTIYSRVRTGIFVSLVFPLMMVFVFGSIQPGEYLQAVVPGLVGFSILTDSLFTVTGMTAKYRFMNIFSQLSLTPLRRSEWLLSVFIWHLLMSGIAFGIIVTIGHFAYSAQVTLTYWIVLYVVAGSLAFVSLGILIGTISKSMESSSLISNAVAFPMMVLAGTFFPISFLPWYLQDFVHVLPLYYFNTGLGDIMTSTNFNQALLYLAILGAVAIAFFALATRLFKWREA